MFGDDKEKWAVNELVRKSEELKRLPRKDDFDDATRSRIKAFLGPWPGETMCVWLLSAI